VTCTAGVVVAGAAAGPDGALVLGMAAARALADDRWCAVGAPGAPVDGSSSPEDVAGSADDERVLDGVGGVGGIAEHGPAVLVERFRVAFVGMLIR
jgi:hypothetical protein